MHGCAAPSWTHHSARSSDGTAHVTKPRDGEVATGLARVASHPQVLDNRGRHACRRRCNLPDASASAAAAAATASETPRPSLWIAGGRRTSAGCQRLRARSAT